MPALYDAGAAPSALADKICALPWLPSTVLANSLPAKYKRLLYLDGNLNHTMRSDYNKMITGQRHKHAAASRTESVDLPLFPHRVSLIFGDANGLAADGCALATIIKCKRASDFNLVSGSADEMAQR